MQRIELEGAERPAQFCAREPPRFWSSPALAAARGAKGEEGGRDCGLSYTTMERSGERAARGRAE